MSETGLTADGPDAQGCETCQRFSAFHNDVLDAEKKWAEMQPKRESLKARQTARFNFMQIRMNFDNWLSGVEAPTEQQEESHLQMQKGTNRAVTKPSNSERTGDATASCGLSGIHVLEQHNASLCLRPSPKRSRCTTTSLPNRKRLKFSDSVEFRNDYRDSSEYMRSDEKYVRGRHAPPDGSEYLDTSGSAQTFLKFTGVRRVKGDWVEVTDAVTGSKRRTRETAGDTEMHTVSPDDIAPDFDSGGGAPPDLRAMRLARRIKNTSGGSTTRLRGSASPASESVDQKSIEGNSTEGKLSIASKVDQVPLPGVAMAKPVLLLEPVGAVQTSEASEAIRAEFGMIPNGNVVSQEDDAASRQCKTELKDAT